ncbi:disulfide bond formation protein B [Porticoccus sp. W117]|uniref:disulfide bond formation protein B n=1 Tax=Porticoccus sp. W117 TaxID=3054777 RepID=UPI0025953DEA|nr:disulfide bond formation protein B [Porticoccus sp. W117]MDM3870435.1 disulfide bond formation protein B [Porticoccus sp. W117]
MSINRLPSIRTCFLIIFLICCGLMATAFYMQEVMELEPCYMCILQRVFVIATGVVALLAAVHNPRQLGVRIYSLLTAAMALTGSFFSGKQLWLQSLPKDHPYIPDCGASVDYLFQVESFTTALSKLLRGDGNCAEVQWTFLGLSIPGWTLVCFIGLAALALWQICRKTDKINS